jgi:PIN domain nuclease of toxin-antitoxin system
VNLLLDAHVFLWWDQRSLTLNGKAQNVIQDGANHVYVSAASVWEIAIKRRRDKVTFPWVGVRRDRRQRLSRVANFAAGG